MDEDVISKNPVQTNPEKNSENTEDEASGVRVFDITPDLNIAPAKDEVEKPEKISIPEIIQQPPKIPVPPILEKEPVKIISNSEIKKQPEIISNEKPQIGPANPPAKTIGQSFYLSQKVLKENTQINQPSKPATLQEAVAVINNQPKVTPVQTQKAEVKNDPNIKPLRTYEGDFAEAMAKRHFSTTSFVVAENKKKEEQKNLEPQELKKPEEEKKPVLKIAENQTVIKNAELLRKSQEQNPEQKNQPKSTHSTRNFILGIFSLILICGGVYAGYFLYLKSPLSPIITNSLKQNGKTTTQKSNFSDSIISPDSTAILNIDNANKTKIISLIEAEVSNNQPEGSIKEIILSKTNTDGIQERVPASQIFNLMNIKAPDIFSRSLSSDWMLGVYAGSYGQKNVFVMTTNNFFQNAFAGTIQWENTMPEDLKPFLYSGFSSSESSSTDNFTIQGQYKDRIISSKDVREYVAENGHIIFLYSFISNDKLVIANNEEALQEIIKKLEKSNYVR